MSIITLTQAKAELNISSDDTSKDDQLQDAVDAITAVVEDYKDEVIEVREIVEEVELSGRSSFVLRHRPVVSLTAMTAIIGGSDIDVTGLHVTGGTGKVRFLSGGASGLYEVTFQAGYENAPVRYQKGALVILQHTWETQRGVGGAMSGVVGQEEIHNYDPRQTYAIPRKALEWLGAPLPAVA